MKWHILTGEYPPQPGGVSDYTYWLAHGLADAGDEVHVWAPGHQNGADLSRQVAVHRVAGAFGIGWLSRLERGMHGPDEQSVLLLQYVPHAFGWKSMNLALCCWLALYRQRRVWIMFHEVAFPLRRGQLWKHCLLALVHRVMAWSILKRAERSFTSVQPYLEWLQRVSPDPGSISLLRIFSNIPCDPNGARGSIQRTKIAGERRYVVGVFGSFRRETCRLLLPILSELLENPEIQLLLIGPAARLIESLEQGSLEPKSRMTMTGRLQAREAGPFLQACDALVQVYPDGATASHGTLLAALACGRPVVTTAGPATERLLQDSQALVFANNHPESIRSMVEGLLANPARASEVGASGRQLYEDVFDVRHTITTLRQGIEAQWIREGQSGVA